MPFLNEGTNNIYIRAKNNANKVMRGKAKAFCAPYNVLYIPPKWKPLTTISGETEVPLVAPVTGSNSYTEDIPAGEVAVVLEPFELDKLANPKMHTCMMGLLTDTEEKYITLPTSFKGDAELWQFLREKPQIAYNNIKVVELNSHVSSHTIEFGNHDEASRKFILSLKVESGLDTLEGTKVLVVLPDNLVEKYCKPL